MQCNVSQETGERRFELTLLTYIAEDFPSYKHSSRISGLHASLAFVFQTWVW